MYAEHARMVAIVSDLDIARLIAEPKSTVDPMLLTPTKRGRGHLQGRVDCSGDDGSRFAILVRRNILEPSDFSIILGWERPDVTGLFHLMRCNGSSHYLRTRSKATHSPAATSTGRPSDTSS